MLAHFSYLSKILAELDTCSYGNCLESAHHPRTGWQALQRELERSSLLIVLLVTHWRFGVPKFDKVLFFI